MAAICRRTVRRDTPSRFVYRLVAQAGGEQLQQFLLSGAEAGGLIPAVVDAQWYGALPDVFEERDQCGEDAGFNRGPVPGGLLRLRVDGLAARLQPDHGQPAERVEPDQRRPAAAG